MHVINKFTTDTARHASITTTSLAAAASDGDNSQGLVEEHLDDQIAPFDVVEEDEQRPVDQPGALLQRLHVGDASARRAVVDKLAKLRQVVEGTVPVLHQNLAG